MRKLRSFRDNRSGIFWVIFVGVATIMVATVTWLVVMLIAGKFIDVFGAQAAGPMTLQLGETEFLQGSVVVVIIDVGMVVWMFVSAFIKERQESPMEL